MPRKKIEILDAPEVRLRKFSSGAVCEVLQISPSRLQNLVEGKSYQLSLSGKLAKGTGQRYMFPTEDIYRLAIAQHLVIDGFSPRLINELLAEIEDYDFFRYDQHDRVDHPGIAFKRSENGTEFERFQYSQPPVVNANSKIYYLLNVARIVDGIDQQLARLK